MGNIIRLDDVVWEVNPSTRESTSIWTKSEPVNVTLATPGTAEDLFTVSPLKPTINLVTNPSMETGDPPTGYTAIDATLAQDATYYQYGTKSLEITPDDSAAGEGAYYSLGTMPANTPLAVSCYFRRASGSGDDIKIGIYGVTTGSLIATGNTVSLTTGWQRSIAIARTLPLTEEIRIYMITNTKHGTAIYADGLQAEMRPFVTDYCDGAQGYWCQWGNYDKGNERWVSGTAHASSSFRLRGIKEVRGYRLFATRDCYIAFDRTATSTVGELIVAGTDFWEDHPIRVWKNISILNRYAGEQPQVYGRVYGV